MTIGIMLATRTAILALCDFDIETLDSRAWAQGADRLTPSPPRRLWPEASIRACTPWVAFGTQIIPQPHGAQRISATLPWRAK